MALQFYNSLTRRKEEFRPLTPPEVRMYTCGPTVYNYAHIGNFRAYIFEDLLRRYLKYKGYRVMQVMNLTDVDDKTIRDSRAAGISLNDFTAKYKKAFFEDLDTLRIERAEVYPAATEHIPEMVDLVRKLQENGHTYEADGSIYFRISSFPDYGKLAHLDPESMRGSGRVDNDEYEKDDVRDFALWKSWVPEDGDVYWETELGKGRPGWHIECSAMSTRYLGTHFDIHTGGVDNRFPHHENEIAQSVCGYHDKFVNYWMHCEFLLVDSKKMSKSLGNFYTLRDLLDKGLDPVAIRYTLLSVHYRQKLNFSFDAVRAAAGSVQRIRDFYASLKEVNKNAPTGKVNDLVDQAKQEFTHGLDDDLNIAPALAAVFNLIREVNRVRDEQGLAPAEAEKVRTFLESIDTVLAVLPTDQERNPEVEELIRRRTEARRNKDWQLADQLREEIAALGYVLEDGPEGTRYKKRLSDS